MTPQELTARLAEVRIPAGFARFGWQDALAPLALGLIAGLLVLALLRMVTVRRVRPVDQARSSIRALAQADPQTRITGLAALLQDHGGTRPDGLHAALYDPRATVDPALLEIAVITAAKRRSAR
ncbi:hypothetical protein ACOXXX_06105 [Thalassococcus sp. BH17M4-6]|uniref:hypothetical protein n=1 Tax=Thalassococcus sp. BH17M4-6 TaxID=3413148 RepID=UPI003BDABF72